MLVSRTTEFQSSRYFQANVQEVSVDVLSVYRKLNSSGSTNSLVSEIAVTR